MNWLGSDPKHAREMDLDDIFLYRIQLLVIMANNFLRGVPLGELQRRAMERNAMHIETECNAMHIETECNAISDHPDWKKPVTQSDYGNYLCHRLKLLSRMITAVVRGVPIGDYRKQAMRDNLSVIDSLLGSNAWKRNFITHRMSRLPG